jgi:hypothetical protein
MITRQDAPFLPAVIRNDVTDYKIQNQKFEAIGYKADRGINDDRAKITIDRIVSNEPRVGN